MHQNLIKKYRNGGHIGFDNTHTSFTPRFHQDRSLPFRETGKTGSEWEAER